MTDSDTKDQLDSIDAMRAERRRLAAARGLLTRERNKLAGERDQLAELAQTIDEAGADLERERQLLAEARAHWQAREAEFSDLLEAAARKDERIKRLKARLSASKRTKRRGGKKLKRKLKKAEARIRKLKKAARDTKRMDEPEPAPSD